MKFIATILLYLLENTTCNRPCDFVVREGYMYRWYVIPRNRFLNIYFHYFTGSDDRVFHDHPWYSFGILLDGSYVEHTPYGDNFYRDGNCSFRSPEYLHWVEINNPVKTLFITGPKLRAWGFLSNGKWIPFYDYLGVPKTYPEKPLEASNEKN